jgi:hypothetical protein
LSTNIEDAFHKRFDHEPKGWLKRIFINSRNDFYLVVLCALGIVLLNTFFMCIRQGCKQKETTSEIKQKVQNVTKDNCRQE